LVFAKGNSEKAELADFVLHVQYVAPHDRYVGLSNFFQMKRVTDETCRAAIDLRQIRFWACPSKMSYWDWDPKNTVNVSDYYRHGECSYYWFAHSSKEAHNALADGLLANARSWMSSESRHSVHSGWLHPFLFMRILASMTPPVQLDPIHLVSSCASCASVKEAVRVQRSTRICTVRTSGSKSKTIHLMNDAKKLVIPLYPCGLRFLDCVFLHHGVDSGLLSKILSIASELGPAKQAQKSGLVIVLTIRLGGQDVRNEREIRLA